MMSTQRPSRRLPGSVLAATVLVLFVLVALAARSGLHGARLNPKIPAVTGTATQITPVRRPQTSGGKVSVALPHWIGWTALGLVVTVLFALSARHLPALRATLGTAGEADDEESPADVPLPPSVGEVETSARQAALRDAVMRSLEEIRRDPDARRAIIGAYRLMEGTLARTGLPRAPAEAPREYLARALAALEVGPAAPRRLTALFERARFDDAELDLSLRDQAVDALLELQRAL
jgi:hypothetical protein